MNVSKILSWVKANVVTVIFFVVMIAAMIALPLVAANLNTGVKEEMNARLDQKRKLEGLRKTTYQIQSAGLPQPITGTGVINEAFVEQYEALVREESEDAEAVLEMAIEHNQKGRGVVELADPSHVLFPEPDQYLREVLPGEFATALTTAYDQLLTDVNAGSPPDPEAVRSTITRNRRNFLTTQLQKEPSDTLTASEQEKLAQYLTDIRLAEYVERAGEISFYASPEVLHVPSYDHTVEYSLYELFTWQWDYWVVEDLLLAIEDANADDRYARIAPVKRVLDLSIGELTAPAAPAGGQGGFGGGRGAPAAPAAAPPDPKMPVPTNYAVSVTGRVSNALYDVRMVNLNLVVATARVPEILDAISARNFMTVTNVNLRPRDAFADAALGYYYGVDDVSELSLQIETIWFREWTKAFMPVEVKTALGVPMPPPATPGGPDGMMPPGG